MADVQIDLSITEPKELCSLGLRAYYVNDYNNAVAALGKATQLMAKEHGDEHDSLGEVYVHYARALLELSREEISPIGDAVPQEEESDSSQDDDGVEPAKEEHSEAKEAKEKEGSTVEKPIEEKKDTDKTEDKKKENTESLDKEETDKTKEKVETEKSAEKKEDVKNKQNGDSVETKEESSDKNGDVEETNSDAEPGCSTGPKEEEEEDCSDLQLAWEVLEVAKRIFEKRGDKGKKRLADTLVLLGEISLESENFKEGVEDMKRGLEIQKAIFDPLSRRLAETHYKIGTALTMLSSMDEALESYNMSLNILKNRAEKLQKDLDEKKTEHIKTAKDEIEEIQELIPDVENKITDTKLMKDEAAQLLLEMTKSATVEKKVETVSPSKDVKDISHLVKRKRKVEDELASEEIQPTKKPTP